MRRSPWIAKKTYCNHNHKHDSKKEATACDLLYLLQRQGLIKDLQQQPQFELQPRFKNAAGKIVRPITYTADFQFRDTKTGRLRIIDIKSAWTRKQRDYAIRKKMLDYKLVAQGLYLEEEI